MKSVGVLALQGSVIEHMKALSRINDIKPFEIRTCNDLEKVAGLIIPGGESTTLGRLIKVFELFNPIIERIKDGMPVWGTCAGMILLAKDIVNENYTHFATMDISVRRNAYGSQLNSFNYYTSIPEVSEDKIEMVFIRAPWVERVYGEARTLAEYDKKIVAVKQKNMLATSFHPELTNDLSFHRYFVNMINDENRV